MKRITINKKEYTLEFTIEASLYDECTKSVMDQFVKSGMVSSAAKDGDTDSAIENVLDTIASLPQRTLTLFHAGLLEHHGPEGDGSVQGRADAKSILAAYLKESKKSYRDVFADMMEIMADDSFFDLIGLNQWTTAISGEEPMEKPQEEQAENGKVGKNTSDKK